MKRKQFLSKGFAALGVAFVAPLAGCGKDDSLTDTTSSGGTGSSGSSSENAGCTVTPTETAGPFPTKTPADLVRADIRSDRTGIETALTITLHNTSNSCAALEGAIVDIWHCDKDGNYSEYGGSGMQSTNYTSVHFLRGRQVSNQNGQVGFTTIFPGWYNGRATHIHVHIYNSSGKSLLITQIAFPEGSGSAVSTVNGSDGVAYGYTKGMTGYTYNSNDNVFSDDTAGIEICTVTGSNSAGYTITHDIYVQAG